MFSLVFVFFSTSLVFYYYSSFLFSYHFLLLLLFSEEICCNKTSKVIMSTAIHQFHAASGGTLVEVSPKISLSQLANEAVDHPSSGSELEMFKKVPMSRHVVDVGKMAGAVAKQSGHPKASKSESHHDSLISRRASRSSRSSRAESYTSGRKVDRP